MLPKENFSDTSKGEREHCTWIFKLISFFTLVNIIIHKSIIAGNHSFHNILLAAKP